MPVTVTPPAQAPSPSRDTTSLSLRRALACARCKQTLSNGPHVTLHNAADQNPRSPAGTLQVGDTRVSVATSRGLCIFCPTGTVLEPQQNFSHTAAGLLAPIPQWPPVRVRVRAGVRCSIGAAATWRILRARVTLHPCSGKCGRAHGSSIEGNCRARRYAPVTRPTAAHGNLESP